MPHEPDEERAEGSIPLYLNPAPIPEVEAENARLQGYCETIDKLRAMDQEAANKAWIEIERLRAALERIAGYSMSQFPNRTAMIIEMHHVANDALGIKRGE